MKLRKAMTMKILLRRKTVLNRVTILLQPAGPAQCHPFPLKGRLKSGLYKCTEEHPVPGNNRRLSTRRHLGSQSSYGQSRASSYRLKNKAGEAAFVNPNALSIEGRNYDSFPYVEDTTNYNADSLQGNAVKVCRWLFHHHFI